MANMQAQMSLNSIDENIQGLYKQNQQLRRANSILRNKIKELELLVQVSSLLSQTLDKDEIINSLREFFRRYFTFDEFCLLLKTESDDKLEIISSFGFQMNRTVWVYLDNTEGLLYQAFSKHRRIYITKMSPNYKYELNNRRGLDGSSLVILPLLPVESRIIGLICLLRRQEHGFSQNELIRLNHVIHHVAAIIDKTILFHNTKELAFTDGLTGIFNRRYFDQRYPREIIRAKRYHRSLAILMIDIDYFKKYNDTCGHLMGDEVLKKVADILVINLRRADILCRYGGEEFVVILPESDLGHGLLVAEKLRKAVMHTKFYGEEQLPQKQLTLSIGVSAFPEMGESEKEILAGADQALYNAKKSGRNRVVIIGK
jgi:diguanylate cyclase (GGDEF)-like protein